MQGTLGEVTGNAPVTVLDDFPSARPLPDAVRASLEAVKAAQLAARVRARREMWQARAVVAGVAAAVVIAGLVAWPRMRAARAARAASAATTAARKRPAPPIENEPPSTVPAVPAPGGLLAAGVAERAVVAPDVASLDACRDSYQGKRWRAAAAACATAFAARPDDAKLALRVAEAEYARDHLAEAREWAQRTLALDAKQADALAVLGRSEQRAGDGEAAARAFRRYLALAPRGWHAAEARAALRGDRASTHRPVARATAASAGQPRQRDEGAAPQPAPAIEPTPIAPAPSSPPSPAIPDAP